MVYCDNCDIFTELHACILLRDVHLQYVDSVYSCFVAVGVQSLILQGRISEARLLVHCTYKGLLENNLELLFRLKCRQFVEMIGGYDRGEIISPTRDLRLSCHSDINGSTDLQQRFMDGESPKLSGSVDVVGQGDSTARNGQVSIL